MTVTATSANGAQADVTGKASFSSNNTAAASVSASGTVEANGPGTCDVTSIVDGVKATLKITVAKAEPANAAWPGPFVTTPGGRRC